MHGSKLSKTPNPKFATELRSEKKSLIYGALDFIKEAQIEFRVSLLYPQIGDIVRVPGGMYVPGRTVIRLNSLCSEKDRIKTFIHEAIHLSPRYNKPEMLMPFSNPLYDGPKHQKLEQKIDRLADIIFNGQPLLVKYLRTTLKNEHGDLRDLPPRELLIR
jgi:hypothetical protein